MTAMLVVELKGDDLVNDGAFVRIGRVARAIAIALTKGTGHQTDTDLAAVERELFPRIHAGVQLRKLNPLRPRGLRPLSRSDYGNGIVPIGELVEWGRSERFDFTTGASEPAEDVLAIRIHKPAAQIEANDAGEVGAGGTAKETPAERQARLQDRCNKVKASGVKAWKKKTADEEKISTSMLDRILRRESVPAKPKPGTIEALKGIGKNNNRC